MERIRVQLTHLVQFAAGRKGEGKTISCAYMRTRPIADEEKKKRRKSAALRLAHSFRTQKRKKRGKKKAGLLSCLERGTRGEKPVRIFHHPSITR